LINLGKKMNVICFAAHPDDETMLCGGTLALLAARGAKVHIACLTRGEGGEMGEPPLTTREQLGDVREAELVAAVQVLGGSSLTFLGYIDPVVGPEDSLFAPEHDDVMLAGQIINTIKQFKADVVLGHGSNGEYGHPAHVLMHQMTLAAVASLRKEAELSPLPSLYTFSAMYPDHPYPRIANKDDIADIMVDVSTVLDKKEAAALAHKTQNALFVRRRSQELGRAITVREALLPTEALHRVFGEPGDVFSKLLTG
jgi:N-acetylglucosamine malate deacetylase 2